MQWDAIIEAYGALSWSTKTIYLQVNLDHSHQKWDKSLILASSDLNGHLLAPKIDCHQRLSTKCTCTFYKGVYQAMILIIRTLLFSTMCGVCLLIISITFNHQSINQFLFQAQHNGTQSKLTVWPLSTLMCKLTIVLPVHLDSQAGCDDSIQLNSYFLGAQKRLDSWFQIMLALRSTIQVWFFQSYGKLERIQLNSIHSWDWMQNAANVHPFAHLPHLLLAYLANQLQSIQLLLFDVARFKGLHQFSLRWKKSIIHLCHCLPFTIKETTWKVIYTKWTAIQTLLFSRLFLW